MLEKVPSHPNAKNRLHCRICGYGARRTFYDYEILRHILRVHGSPFGEAEEWNILSQQEEGDDSRCFYHLHATIGAVPLAEAEAKEKRDAYAEQENENQRWNRKRRHARSRNSLSRR